MKQKQKKLDSNSKRKYWVTTLAALIIAITSIFVFLVAYDKYTNTGRVTKLNEAGVNIEAFANDLQHNLPGSQTNKSKYCRYNQGKLGRESLLCYQEITFGNKTDVQNFQEQSEQINQLLAKYKDVFSYRDDQSGAKKFLPNNPQIQTGETNGYIPLTYQNSSMPCELNYTLTTTSIFFTFHCRQVLERPVYNLKANT